MYQWSPFCNPNPCLELLCVNHYSTRHWGSLWQLQMSQRSVLHGYCFPSICAPHTGRRKIIHVKTSSSVGNPLTLFSLSQKVHQYMSPVVSLCQNCSTELSFPDGRSILLHSKYVSLTILRYDDKHLPSWTPCTLVWVTGSPVCCGCAASGSHPIFYTIKQGTSALPVYFGSAYFPLTAVCWFHSKWIHAFICSRDISCCSKATPVLELVDAWNLCRGIRSTSHSSSSRAAGHSWNSLCKR